MVFFAKMEIFGDSISSDELLKILSRSRDDSNHGSGNLSAKETASFKTHKQEYLSGKLSAAIDEFYKQIWPLIAFSSGSVLGCYLADHYQFKSLYVILIILMFLILEIIAYSVWIENVSEIRPYSSLFELSMFTRSPDDITSPAAALELGTGKAEEKGNDILGIHNSFGTRISDSDLHNVENHDENMIGAARVLVEAQSEEKKGERSGRIADVEESELSSRGGDRGVGVGAGVTESSGLLSSRTGTDRYYGGGDRE